jgi:hypothetical protein
MDRPAVGLVACWPLPGGGQGIHAELLCVKGAADSPVAHVIGRHSDVDSPPILGAALRHAVLLAWPPAPGEPPRVEVIDLATDVGIGVIGCEQKAAAHLESTGPLRCGVGAADVIVIPVAAHAPLFPAGFEVLVRSLASATTPVRRFRPNAAEGDALEDVLAWHGQLEAAARAEAVSARQDDEAPEKGVVLPQPAQRGAVADAFVNVPSRRREEASSPQWRERMTQISQVICHGERAQALRRERRGEAEDDASTFLVQTTWRELEEGLLLGRYERCSSHGDVASDGGVSRVHALVVARRDRLYVIDTGSTNGTRIVGAGGEESCLDSQRRVAALREGDALWLHRSRCVLALERGASPASAR